LAKKTGLQGGPSTGTNLYGSLKLICNMKRHHEKGAVVTLVCDKAERCAYHGWMASW
jgi:cysteine synthase A